MIYIIMVGDTCGDDSWAVAASQSKEVAEKYADFKNKLEGEDSFYYYWIKEVELIEEFKEERIESYYNYYVGKEELNDIDDAFSYDYWEIKEFLEEKGFDLTELNEIEKNDTSKNECGNPAHIECIKYLKSKLSEETLKEIVDFSNSPEIRWFNNTDEKENKIYKGDLYVEETEDYIQVFSMNSFDEAKQKAIELYNKWLEKE